MKKIKKYYKLDEASFAGGPGPGSNFYSGADLGTHSPGSLGTRGADSNFSRITMQTLVPLDINNLEDEDEEEEEIFLESLKNLSLRYLLEEYESIDEDLEEKQEEELEEFSGAGGVAGVALPLGRSTKGKKGQKSSNSGGKTFPYSAKNRKNFYKYSKKTYGG